MGASYPRAPRAQSAPAQVARRSVRQDRGVDEECCEIVVTDADAERLTALTRTLVEERLVACGQHVAPIRSVFRWDGAVQEETEARVALHTRRSLVDAV